MYSFDYFFGTILCEMHTDNLSYEMIPTTSYIFWSKVTRLAEQCEIDEPKLPRKCKRTSEMGQRLRIQESAIFLYSLGEGNLLPVLKTPNIKVYYLKIV